MKVREVVRRLLDDGWVEEARKSTGHRQFSHPTKPGKVTVPDQAGDLKKGTLHGIWKQAGLK
jgi:predicted RNA binding protein YcfA (HicA-like mRNA interferase family)